MSIELTLPDKFWRAMARGLDNTVLRLIPSQRVVRHLFALSGPLGSALPRGSTMIRRPDGSLHIRPANVPRDATILFYLHGGGFTIGGPRTHAALAGHLAQAAGMRAVVQRYRLAPEHPFPAAREDAIAGYRALAEAGTAPAAICGDSAGGCLALQTAIHARDTGLPQPRALGLIAPIADLSGDIEARFAEAEDEILIPPVWPERLRAAYLPGIDLTRPDVSPLFADLSGLPPTLIHAGSGEALVHDARRLVEKMDDATLELWDGLPHVWHLHAGRAPAADRAIAAMGAFLARQIDR